MESPEETEHYACPSCGNTRSFVGYDDRGYPGPDECECGKNTCACEVTLEQHFTVHVNGSIDYRAFEGGGPRRGDRELHPYQMPIAAAHSGDVSGKQVERRELWRQRITQQEKSGPSIRAFCREWGLSEPAFYAWRQRLRRENNPVRFALVETKPAAEAEVPIELILASGD